MNIIAVLLISFFVLAGFGTLLHFTHNWLKKGILLHIFSSLNESTWEHMKLLVAPTIFIGTAQYIFLKEDYSNLCNSILILLIVQLITMPLLYETLKLIIKKIPFPITILIFILSILFGLIAEYLMLTTGTVIFPELLALILIVIIVGLFGIFSYFPPRFFILKDPITGGYGDVNR